MWYGLCNTKAEVVVSGDVIPFPGTQACSPIGHVTRIGDWARVSTGEPSVDKALAKSNEHVDKMTRMYEMLAEARLPSPLPPVRGHAATAKGRGRLE